MYASKAHSSLEQKGLGRLFSESGVEWGVQGRFCCHPPPCRFSTEVFSVADLLLTSFCAVGGGA